MFDEMDRLRDMKELQQLLMTARDLGVADRTLWQDRVCQQDGVEPMRELVRLHGELIAYGWIEQNTGIVTGKARRPRLLPHHAGGPSAETARGGRSRCRLTETAMGFSCRGHAHLLVESAQAALWHNQQSHATPPPVEVQRRTMMRTFAVLTLWFTATVGYAQDPTKERWRNSMAAGLSPAPRPAGAKIPNDVIKEFKLTIRDGTFTPASAAMSRKGTLRINTAKKPMEMNIIVETGTEKKRNWRSSTSRPAC